MEVHRMRETTPERFHFYGITHLILQHALRLLDPERIGLSMTVIKCMPPSANGKIRSLREQVSQGTFSGERNVQEQPLFLGAESLAGDVVSRCRSQVAALSLVTETMLKATSPLAERGSMMGCPLLYANRVAGCLLFVSLQPDLFLSPARRSLLEDITCLLTLALKPEEFSPAEAIELFLMPPPAIQRRVFVSFRQRVAQLMQEAFQNGSLLTVTQAEERIWQHLETELIETSRYPFSRETS